MMMIKFLLFLIVNISVSVAAAVSISSNNTVDRFDINTPTAVKVKELTLLISITSGPHHSHLRYAARETWLLPCRLSRDCDYRFFVDMMSHNITDIIKMENETHGDIVFRSVQVCPFLDRHPAHINYGNMVFGTESDRLPDYQLRAMYKIDWKVCFLIWAKASNKMAFYHVFVEDDSFICTENLLHQTRLLKALPADKRGLPFRSGWPMYDGFDDSSTMMSQEIALAFADNYPRPGFNCSIMADEVDAKKKSWLSWGNSWMSNRCGWRSVLQSQLNMTINEPFLHNSSYLHCSGSPPPPPSLSSTSSTDNTNGSSISRIELPCPNIGMIFHSFDAGESLLSKNKVEHMCEYVLLLDKVKNPRVMKKLWGAATAHNYHDFSPIFTHDKAEGWTQVLSTISANEKACSSLSSSSFLSQTAELEKCLQWRRERRDLETDQSQTPDPGVAAYYPFIPSSMDNIE